MVSSLNRIDPDSNLFNQLDHECSYYDIDEFNSAFDSSGVKDYLLLNYNIRSFHKNGNVFIGLIESLTRELDIIVLTGTWNTEMNIDLCKLNGFHDYHTFRSSNRSGGVSVFVNERFKSENLDQFSRCDLNIESCVVKISLERGYILIVGLYRPHSGTVQDFISAFDEFFDDDIFKNSGMVLVCGDFNVNIMFQMNQDVICLLSSMRSKFLLPVITKPTRFSANNNHSPTLIDHIYMNTFTKIASGILNYDQTDHCSTFLKFLVPS